MSDQLDFLAVFQARFQAHVPHHLALGFELLRLSDGIAESRLPYRAEFVGNPRTGVLHGGVVTSLLDSTGGASVMAALGRPVVIATLDLRIDYLRASTPGRALGARAECYKLTPSVAFVRGSAFNDDPHDPVAAMSATFMLNSTPPKRPTPVAKDGSS